MDKKRQKFHSDSLDLLDLATDILQSIADGALFRENYRTLFRAIRSVKAAAGILELGDVYEKLQAIEDQLFEARNVVQIEHAKLDKIMRDLAVVRGRLEAAVNGGPSVERSLGRILIFDDEPELVEILSLLMQSAGFTVRGSTQPELIEEIVEEFSPDAVLTDIHMPKMDGHQVLAFLHRTHPEIPVIFISGAVSKEGLLDAITKGVFAVIEKPFNTAHVINTALNACRKRQMTDLLNSSVNLLMSQYADLDDYLAADGRAETRAKLREEIRQVFLKRRAIKKSERED